MTVVFKFELEVKVTDSVLFHLMSNGETKKLTLSVFREKMLEDLSKSLLTLPHSTIKVNEVFIKEETNNVD